MKTPVAMYAKNTKAPKMSGTDRGRVNVATRGAGETGEYGSGKGKARICEAFPANRNHDMANEGKGTC